MVFRHNIFISTSVFLGIVFLFSTCNSTNTNIQESIQESINSTEEVEMFKKIQGFSLENFKIDSSSVKNGQSFSEILQSLNISYDQIYII
jgi:hypothetical protein